MPPPDVPHRLRAVNKSAIVEPVAVAVDVDDGGLDRQFDDIAGIVVI